MIGSHFVGVSIWNGINLTKHTWIRTAKANYCYFILSMIRSKVGSFRCSIILILREIKYAKVDGIN